jgi:hypothetical protein
MGTTTATRKTQNKEIKIPRQKTKQQQPVEIKARPQQKT